MRITTATSRALYSSSVRFGASSADRVDKRAILITQKPIEVIEIRQQVAIPRFSSGPVCLVDGHLARQHLNVSTRQASASLLVARRSNVGSLNFSHVDQGSGFVRHAPR